MKTIIFNQKEINLIQAKKLASDMHDNMLQCLECGLVEEAHELHTKITYLEDLIINAESEDMTDELLEKLNRGIKRAILSVSSNGKGITSRKLEGIIKGYKLATGVDMNKNQVDYLKTISDEQASRILYTINVFRKEVA